MPGLTAAQIATGSKNARKIDPPLTDQDRRGRWRCWLCRSHRWRKGTLRDGHNHYLDTHYRQEGHQK